MPEAFADTCYWLPLLNPTDKWHREARTFSQTNPEVLGADRRSVGGGFELLLRSRRENAAGRYRIVLTKQWHMRVHWCRRRLEKRLSAGSTCIKLARAKAIA